MDFEELRDLVIAWIALSVAFMIALRLITLDYFLIFLFIIAVSFIFHELAHRQIARSNKFNARFKLWPVGIVIALLSSLAGFIFAAPGAVMISPKYNVSYTRRELEEASFKISIAGPATNIILGSIFMLLIPYTEIFYFAAQINIWLGIFNLLPFPPLDGSKVFHYNKAVWVLAFAIAIGLFIALPFVA